MKKPKPIKKKKAMFVRVDLAIYRRSVVFAFGATMDDIRRYALTHRLGPDVMTDDWQRHTESVLKDEGCLGFACPFGERNSDILVSMRKHPVKISEYGTLYHELYHAVDLIALSMDPNSLLYDKANMSEARAYLFEYLSTEIEKATA